MAEESGGGAIKSVGQLIGNIGYRAQLLIVGVLFPGILILLELSAIWALGNDARRAAVLALITGKLENIAIPGIALLILLVVAAYVLGYFARDFTFRLSTSWLRRGWPPARRAGTILAQLRTVHGGAQVDRVIARYPIFELLAHEANPIPLNLPRPPDFYIREYCKLWMRTRAPSLVTDSMEAEINMVVGFVIPVFLAIIPSAVFLPALAGVPFADLAVGVFALLGFWLFWNINAVRCQETEEAIGNFLFAHWMGLDAPAPRRIDGSR